MHGRASLSVRPRQMRAFGAFDLNLQRLSTNVLTLRATNGNHTGSAGFSVSVLLRPRNCPFFLTKGVFFFLQAAKFGWGFLDLYNPGDFVAMGQALKVLNSVRFYEIGIPLTYSQ